MKILNKKGFTLVELLAVIVILAIVAGITLVTVLPALKDSRQKAFEISAQTAASYLEKRYELYTIGMDMGEPTIDWQKVTQENKDISKEQLIAAGLKPENYISAKWNITDGRAYVTLSASTKTTEKNGIENLNGEKKAGDYYDAKITYNNRYSITESSNTTQMQSKIFETDIEKAAAFIENEYQLSLIGNNTIIKNFGWTVVYPQKIDKDIMTKIGLNPQNYVKAEYYIDFDTQKACVMLYAHTNAIKKATEKEFLIPNMNYSSLPGDYSNFENNINTNDPLGELKTKAFWINVKIAGKDLNVDIKSDEAKEINKITSLPISTDKVDDFKEEVAREYLKIRMKSSGCNW